MATQNPHKRGADRQNDRSLKILVKLLVFMQWTMVFLLVTVPLTVLRAPFFPLRFGSDPNDADAAWPTFYVGAVFDEDITQAALVADGAVIIIYLALGLYVIRQMLGVLRNVKNGDSFARDNGLRLRRMGYAGAVAQLSVYGVWLLAAIVALAGWAEVDGMSVVLTPAPWVVILLAFALATVFRDGAALKEEQDLTV